MLQIGFVRTFSDHKHNPPLLVLQYIVAAIIEAGY